MIDEKEKKNAEALNERIGRICQELSDKAQEMGGGSRGGMIMVGLQDDSEENQKLLRQWQDQCAAQITAGTHSLEEMVLWLSQRYDVEPMEAAPDQIHTKVFAFNVKSHLESLQEEEQEKSAFETMGVDELTALSDDELKEMIQEQFKRLDEQPRPFETDVASLNLSIKAYKLPQTERNMALYEDYLKEEQEEVNRIRRDMPDRAEAMLKDHDKFLSETVLELFTEEKTGLWEISAPFDYNELFHQIRRYMGISQEDIDARNIRFLSYISHESHEGRLQSFEEFQREKGVLR